jgi:hypothetical protein
MIFQPIEFSEDFDKVVRIGTIETYHHRSMLPTDVYIHIEYKAGKLSITGVIGPRSNGDAWGGCGQIDMEFDHRNKSQNDSRYRNPITIDEIKFAPGWSAELWYGLLNVWSMYHLNDLRAACEHQEIMGQTWTTHPSATCPVCDYRLGSQWKRISVPDAVIEFLMILPESDKTPAWV